MKGWYRAVVDCALPPTWGTLKQITAERVNLYRYMPSPGDNIPVFIELLPVDDSLPMEDEIKWAVTRPQNHHSGGGSQG